MIIVKNGDYNLSWIKKAERETLPCTDLANGTSFSACDDGDCKKNDGDGTFHLKWVKMVLNFGLLDGPQATRECLWVSLWEPWRFIFMAIRKVWSSSSSSSSSPWRFIFRKVWPRKKVKVCLLLARTQVQAKICPFFDESFWYLAQNWRLSLAYIFKIQITTWTQVHV